VRRVAGGAANVVGRYPSKKMGRMIQFESHRVELAFVLEFEHDPSVLEYYDQPCRLPLQYTGRSGRRVTARHTPDYFVLRADSAGWEECKTEQQLIKLAEQSPHRCQRDGGGWLCPPGAAHAAMLRLYYRIRSSGTICWTFQRNIQYLADYMRSDLVQKDPAHREALLASVRRIPGISLADLLASATSVEMRDCLYSMIALGDLYVDLRQSSLWDPERVHVFPDHCSEEHRITEVSFGPYSNLIDLRSGDHIRWDTKEWSVANIGATMVGLIAPDHSFTEIPVVALEIMIKERRVQVSQRSMHHESGGLRSEIAAANETDLEIANHRFCAVRSYLRGDQPPGIPPRTVRLWAARFRKAEETFGHGYLGLRAYRKITFTI